MSVWLLFGLDIAAWTLAAFGVDRREVYWPAVLTAAIVSTGAVWATLSIMPFVPWLLAVLPAGAMGAAIAYSECRNWSWKQAVGAGALYCAMRISLTMAFRALTTY